MRLDQWLWTVRLYRTRTLAATAVRTGQVTVNGEPVKPARAVHPDEIVTARTGSITRVYRVIGEPPSRVGAPRVPEFAEDQTPATPAREASIPGQRPRGAGRPTKRDRRILNRFLGE
ncbi:MAG: RNA-binding S4 domain-containing protein [Verrucomicrobiae bacterium]|nr:RNA-binding S4 domain-containing protein [Verrucomicrobiae bacterium]